MKPGSLILVVHFVEGKSKNSAGKDFKKKENLINAEFFKWIEKDIKPILSKEQLDEKGERTLLHFLGEKLWILWINSDQKSKRLFCIGFGGFSF